MSHELRLSFLNFLEQEVRLSKSEAELERLKNEKLRAAVKKGVGDYFEAQTKESKMTTCLKLEEIERLKSEIITRKRLDGFEQKISSIEKTNLELTLHIKNLLMKAELAEISNQKARNPKISAEKNKTKELNVIGIQETVPLEKAAQSDEISCPSTKKAQVDQLHQPMLSVTPRSVQMDNEKQNPSVSPDESRLQSPMDLTPRSAKQELRNSQEDIRRQSPKKRSPRTYNQDTARLSESPTTTPSKQNEALRPCFERLPLPGIESFLDDESQESGNSVEVSSTDSDLGLRKPTTVPIPVRLNVFEGGMGREGADALRPRPVIRKSCQLFGDSLSTLGDGDTVLGVDNEALAEESGDFAQLVLLASLNSDESLT